MVSTVLEYCDSFAVSGTMHIIVLRTGVLCTVPGTIRTPALSVKDIQCETVLVLSSHFSHLTTPCEANFVALRPQKSEGSLLNRLPVRAL